MKKLNFPVVVILRLAICSLLIASATQSASANESRSSHQGGVIFATTTADGGRLVINRSPALGSYVSVSVRIDGKLAGLLTRGRTFETNLTPGNHRVTADAGDGRTPWYGTLSVRAGQTYAYTASLSANQLVLTPATASR